MILPIVLASAFSWSAAAVIQPAGRASEARGSVAGLFRADDYPGGAAARGAQGSVDVRLGIGTDGLVRSCTVVHSSGHADLDERTCKVLRERARYQPARDARGRPAPDSQTVRISWRLQDSGPPAAGGFRFAPFRLTVALNRSAEGAQSCWLEMDGRRFIERSGTECTTFGPFASPVPGEHRFVTEFVPAGAPAPTREPQVSELISEAEAEISIQPDGTIGTCRVVREAGRFAGGDYCRYLRDAGNDFDPSTDGRPRSGRLRTSISGPAGSRR